MWYGVSVLRVTGPYSFRINNQAVIANSDHCCTMLEIFLAEEHMVPTGGSYGSHSKTKHRNVPRPLYCKIPQLDSSRLFYVRIPKPKDYDTHPQPYPRT
jgi:hypothetical protein